MIRYLCHTVYVVTIDYPTDGKLTSIEHDIVRAAERRDLATEKLGVIKDGKVLPLSEAERRIIIERRAVRPGARSVHVQTDDPSVESPRLDTGGGGSSSACASLRC